MGATSSPSKNFADLLSKIKTDYPTVSFEPDETFRWSSKHRVVYYDKSASHAIWSLLHELGHVVNNHSGYRSDPALVQMEVEAWHTALKLAESYDYSIDEEYVQDCIDSYRNWHYKRSTCPVCAQTGVSRSEGEYFCINCKETWRVTPNRFCRVYRRRKLDK